MMRPVFRLDCPSLSDELALCDNWSDFRNFPRKMLVSKEMCPNNQGLQVQGQQAKDSVPEGV